MAASERPRGALSLDVVGRVERALETACALLAACGFPRHATVLLGVSGGQDSLTLGHALAQRLELHGWMLHVAHVDHQLRASAVAEAAALAALVGGWGLPLHVLSVDVPSYRRRHRLNAQAAARYARYQTLAECASRVGAVGVLVGHTADDVAETFLLHLLRGAGLDGLSAMPWAQRLPGSALGPPIAGASLPDSLLVGRPLLALARADTAAYCTAQGFAPFVEPAAPYRRNRVRDTLLPILDQFNPRARQAVAAAARALAEEREALAAIAEQHWTSWVERRAGEVELPLERWLALPAALQKRLLRRAVAAVRGTDADVSARVLAAARRLADGQSGRRIDLPGGLILAREPGYLRVALRPVLSTHCRDVWVLPVPGEVTLPGLGTLRAARQERAPAALPDARADECWLDGAAVGDALQVRFRASGDRFQPLGLSQSKRLQDFFVDARIPREQRDRTPLVMLGDEVAWVVGARIAEWARVRADSHSVVWISFDRACADAGTKSRRKTMARGDAVEQNI